jgi:hypothetical protein
MASLEECLKQAAHRLDAAIKAELKNRNPQTKKVMEHTPTPWKANSSIIIENDNDIIASLHNGYDEFDNAQANAKRIVECVNACAEFPDPKIDIGLLKLHLEQQNKKLASCEAALAERDVNIQALQDRVKELEKENPISQIFSFEKPETKEELADAWRESKTEDEWIALLKKHNHYGYDRGIILSELIEMWELETQTS